MAINKIVSFIKEKREFIFFMFLNFFDKGLTFVIPLILLYISDDRILYNEFEYIYSWGLVLVIFYSFTLPNYLFYGYKQAVDRDRYIEDFDASFKFSNLLSLPLVVILLILGYLGALGVSYTLVGFIFIRVLYLNITTYLTAYYRLKDTISHIFYYTTISSVIIILSLFFQNYYGNGGLGPIFLIQFAAVLFFVRRMDFNKLKQTLVLIKEAIAFTWPTVLHLFLFMGVNNFAKIYAFNFLNEDEMTILSFVQRFALVIQLVHSSVLAFFLKRMFMEDRFFNKKIFVAYIAIMSLSLIMVYLVASLFYPYFFQVPFSGFNELLLIILLYTAFWSVASYSEFHFNKYGKPIYVLLNAIPAVVFYTLWILLIEKTLMNLSLGMLFFSIILILTCYFSLFYRKSKLLKTLDN